MSLLDSGGASIVVVGSTGPAVKPRPALLVVGCRMTWWRRVHRLASSDIGRVGCNEWFFFSARFSIDSFFFNSKFL